MRYSISDTAEFGDLTRGNRVINDESRKAMKEILKEIQTGQFAREWILENQTNRPCFNAMRRMDQEHQIETVGRDLRSKMSWIKAKASVQEQVETKPEQHIQTRFGGNFGD
jgi:ketol-acid reductoisomerase